MKDFLTRFFSYLAGLFLVFVLIWIFQDIISHSLGEINLSYLLEAPRSAGRKGGVFPIIVSTLSILMVCLIVVVPFGLGTSLFLSEFEEDFPRFIPFVRKSIDVLAGVPSIVFGLFGNALFCLYLDFSFSILSGGLTLSLMALPLFIKTVEEGIRLVPKRYRLVSASLGFSQTTIIFKIIIPYAIPSIIVGIVLSIGRALAETAALIFTSGYVDRMPESLLDSGRSLSIHIYDLAMNVPGGDSNAYKSAFILITIILLTNGFVNIALRHWYKKRVAL